MHAVSSTVVRLAAIALAASTGFAQTCVTVIPDGTVGLGTDPADPLRPIVPRFATTWDPDGDGPQPTKLLVERGRFGFGPSQFIPSRSSDVLMTDGMNFDIIARPSGFELVGLGVYQSQIYALGQPTGGSELTLFRRDGDAWTPINLSVQLFYSQTGGFDRLQMLETSTGLLIGNVRVGTASPVRCIVLDPSSASISVTSIDGFVARFAKVEDTVYALGVFSINGASSKIARIINGEWQSLDNVGGAVPNTVSGVAKYQGRLFASGNFQAVGQAPTGLVELTPQGWQRSAAALPVVSSLGVGLVATSQGLIAAGNGRLYRIQNDAVVSETSPAFPRSAGSADHDIVGVWNDKAVVRTNALYEWGSPGPTFADSRDTVLLRGIFVSDGANTFNVTPTLNGSIFDLINFQGHTYAVGQFKSADAQSVRFVARREVDTWHPVDLTGGPQRRVNGATIWNGLLTVSWTRPRAASSNVDSFVSTWDGTTWNTFPGPSGSITSLEASSTDLYCTTSVFNGDNRLFRFDAGQWLPLISSRSNLGLLSRVGDDVYLGSQKLVGNNTVPQVALDTGALVRPLATHAGRTIGVGQVAGQSTVSMYELQNGVWTRVSPNFAPTLTAASLARGNEFFGIGNSVSSGFAITSWNGATWTTRISSAGAEVPTGGGGLNPGSINSLIIDAETGKLRFGSWAHSLFGASTDFTGLLDFKARISFSRVPLETRVLPGDTTTLRAQVVSEGQFTYQWTRDDVALVDGVLPTGEVISGATTPTLTITNSTAAVNGSYMLTVTPVDASLFCGPESTFPIPVTVERFCDSIDFNNNFVFPEDQDVIDFFNVLAGAACP
jgi:hypothetical protein